MIKPILIAALLAAPVAQANTIHDQCVKISAYAENMYINALSGVPYSDSLRTAQGNDHLLALVEIAYSLPQWRADHRKIKEAAEWRDMAFKDCVVRYSR